MRNKISVTIFFLLSTILSYSQTWSIELEKHIEKSISEINDEMEVYFESVGRTRENKYHKYQRWYDYAANHQNKEGFLFNHVAKNEKLLKQINAKIDKYSSTSQSGPRHYHGGWNPVNPNNFDVATALTPVNGRINCIAKPSPISTIIYAGTATGGVWKSINNGASWVPLWDGMVQTGVSSIVVDYNNVNHILAVTGDADSRFIPTQGVYQSYDGGDTWTSVIKFKIEDLHFGYKLLQSKTNEHEYYLVKAGSGNNVLKFNNLTGVTEYQNLNSTVFDIEYQTNENNILWAASSTGIYKQDGSNTWSEVNHTNLPTSTFSRSAVAMAPSNENVIYYAVAKKTNTETFYGLYKSPNKGLTWDILYDTTNTDIMTYQCSYNFTLDIDPEDEDKVYFGTGYLYESSVINGEMEFTQIEDYLHSDIHNSYHIGDNHYVCTDGGLSVKTSGSSIYTGINNGLICSQFYDLHIHGSKIIGGTQDNGTMMWDIGDATGFRVLGSDGFDCIIDPTNPNIIFASTQDYKVRSTDNMATYTNIFATEWHDPIVHSVDDPNKIIIHAIDELKVSYNNGVTFPESHSVFSSALNVNSLSQCEADPNVLYLSKGDSLARTENFNDTPTNVTWTKKETFSMDIGKGLLVHPDSCDVVFLTRRGYHMDQIYKSEDGGDSFTSYSQGISELPVYCIYYDHVNGNGYYIGTELGVFYRNSTMEEWIPFSTYLPRVPVYDLKVNNNYIYAATYGRGVWRSPGYKVCDYNLTLTQLNDPTAGTNSGQQIHKASNTIISDRIIRGKDGTDVLYQAGNFIDLTDGFHAKNYNLFMAKAAGCLE